jgi:competence protein ComEA
MLWVVGLLDASKRTMDAARPTSPEPTAATRQQTAPFAAWPRSAQITLACLIGLTTVLLAVHGYSQSRWASRPTVLKSRVELDYRIDLNDADRAQLLQLPGIGDSLVERIEAYRRQHGRFTNVDELAQIQGIGPTTLDRLRSWVCVDSPEAGANRSAAEVELTRSSTGTVQRRKASGSRVKEANLAGPVDVNRASAEELQRLPGIGPKMAERIQEERRKAPFRSVEDLRRVHGIGPKTLERLRPHVTVETEPVPIVNARPS